MTEIDLNRHHIRTARVVKETTHVSIKFRIDAMLEKQKYDRLNHNINIWIIKSLPLILPNRRNNCHPFVDRLLHLSISLRCIQTQNFPLESAKYSSPTILYLFLSSSQLVVKLYFHSERLCSCTATGGRRNVNIKILSHSFGTHLVTSTHVVALVYHWRIIEVELVAQPTIRIVPVLTRNLAALTRFRSATE